MQGQSEIELCTLCRQLLSQSEKGRLTLVALTVNNESVLGAAGSEMLMIVGAANLTGFQPFLSSGQTRYNNYYYHS